MGCLFPNIGHIIKLSRSKVFNFINISHANHINETSQNTIAEKQKKVQENLIFNIPPMQEREKEGRYE